MLDNSVAVAWCFEAEQTPPLMALLDRVESEGAWAPSLWPLEAVNALMVAERRGRVVASRRRELLGFLRRLPIQIDDRTASEAWLAIAELAEIRSLTAYEAAYFELSIRRGLPLATTDGALRSAAAGAGVEVLPAAQGPWRAP